MSRLLLGEHNQKIILIGMAISRGYGDWSSGHLIDCLSTSTGSLRLMLVSLQSFLFPFSILLQRSVQLLSSVCNTHGLVSGILHEMKPKINLMWKRWMLEWANLRSRWESEGGGSQVLAGGRRHIQVPPCTCVSVDCDCYFLVCYVNNKIFIFWFTIWLKCKIVTIIPRKWQERDKFNRNDEH